MSISHSMGCVHPLFRFVSEGRRYFLYLDHRDVWAACFRKHVMPCCQVNIRAWHSQPPCNYSLNRKAQLWYLVNLWFEAGFLSWKFITLMCSGLKFRDLNATQVFKLTIFATSSTATWKGGFSNSWDFTLAVWTHNTANGKEKKSHRVWSWAGGIF